MKSSSPRTQTALTSGGTAAVTFVLFAIMAAG